MRVSIRDSRIDEAQAIFDLRHDPRLAGMTYRPSIFEVPNSLFAILSPGPDIPTNGWMCSTILFDEIFAGHITQVYRTSFAGNWTALIGWNIIPELWGKGIAPIAVNLLLQDRFSKNNTIKFRAFCFKSNTRSVRVLEKLRFRDQQLRWAEIVNNFLKTRGKYKLLKYGIDYNRWLVSNNETGG